MRTSMDPDPPENKDEEFDSYEELTPEQEIYDPADDDFGYNFDFDDDDFDDFDFDDAGAFRDCGWGTDEDYGCF